MKRIVALMLLLAVVLSLAALADGVWLHLPMKCEQATLDMLHRFVTAHAEKLGGVVLGSAGQLGMAILISGTTTMIWYAPVLIVAAVVTGAFTGYLTQILLGHMDKLQKHA